MRYHRTIFGRSTRSGSILVWSAFILVILVAMVGLVLDGGLMLTHYRRTQNAADAAALAAAYDLMLGHGAGQATATANTFVTDAAHNNLAGATVVANIPPSTGSYAGTANFAEVIVTFPITTYFIQVLPGFNRNQSVTARAVAGIESLSMGEGVMALTPTGIGLSTGGNATLKVNGLIQVNSSDSAAASAGSNGIWAKDVEVVGGVVNPQNFRNYDPNNPASPLTTGASPAPDRFGYLPTPTVANGVSTTPPPSNWQTTGKLTPGVYPGGIQISGNQAYTMAPGIYVLKGGGLSMTGSATLTGNGVMIYNTGQSYDPTTGAPDASDPADPMMQSPPSASDSFGGVKFNANVTLSPLNNASSPFNGMVFYQRRANTQEFSIAGNTSQNQFSGTMYAKWANLKYAGNGTTNAQFIFGSMNLTGSGNVTINYTGSNLGRAPEIYLVE